jgi:hypothetical protein
MSAEHVCTKVNNACNDPACPVPPDCCKQPMVWDPNATGETVGGLSLKGWWKCQQCGKGSLGPKGWPKVWTDAHWRLAKGGGSVETGNGRIRLEGVDGHDAKLELCARIVRLPDLERLAESVTDLLEDEPEREEFDRRARELIAAAKKALGES